MDLDDSFLAKISERTKARREYLVAVKSELSNVAGRKRAILADHLVQNEDTIEPPEDSPKRQCVQSAKSDSPIRENDKENIENMQVDENIPFVPVHAAAKGLAALRKNGAGASEDKSSSDSSLDFPKNKCKTYIFSTSGKDLCSGPKSKLANLANDINQWEDDIPKSTVSSKSATFVKDQSDKISVASSLNTPVSASKSNAFSVKLYYTNKTPQNANVNSESHNNETGLNKCDSKTKGEEYASVANNKNNFENNRKPYKQDRKLDAWEQAISATLESEGDVRSPNLPSKCDTELGIEDNTEINEESGNEIDSEKQMNTENSIKNNNLKSNEHCQSNDQMKCNKSEKQGSVRLENCNATLYQDKNAGIKKIKESGTESSAVDPAELPLSARKALFEKKLLCGTSIQSDAILDQKLSVAQRAAIFETASKVKSSVKSLENTRIPKSFVPSKISSEKHMRQNILNDKVPSPVKTDEHVRIHSETPQGRGLAKVAVNPGYVDSLSPSKNLSSHTRLVQQKLLGNTNNWQQREAITKTVEERKKEISSLVTHWEKLSSVKNDSEEKHIEGNILEEEHEEVFEGSEEVAEIEQPKYGIATDMEEQNEYNSEDEVSDMDESVFDTQGIVQQAVFSAVQEQHYEESKISDINTEENWAKNEVLPKQKLQNLVRENIKNEFSVLSGSDKSSSSNSLDSHSNVSKASSCASSSSVESRGSASLSETSNGTPMKASAGASSDEPLLRTVSFFRKQKQGMKTPPVCTIVRREQVLSPPSDVDQTEVIQEHIKALQEEVLRQQTIISQSSQALNLCNATAEFSGSAEQVEAERLLLIATQKRQACLNEIQRLKTCGVKGEGISDGTGTLTITDIQLPLKRNFITSQLESGKSVDNMVHYFMCLIRHGSQVIMTQMVSTADRVTDGALGFTNHIKLQKLPADFSVVFEVYSLQTKKEILPHEKKYHIKREHSKVRLTPKGKKNDGKILLPAVSSPGGPNAVRSPSFSVIGYTRFTVQNCNKKVFTLDKVPFTSPLDGVLKVKLQLHAEHRVTAKGFLTMFEDVSGFGAWHRRWCSLDGPYLVYWKYPDDEHKKEPIGAIDLKQCITGQVRLVARDICARPHTFQLLIVRPQKEGDKNTLISRCINTLTTTRHLLSADTKDERILWCNKLNEALTNIRKWDPQAVQPTDGMQDQFEKYF